MDCICVNNNHVNIYLFHKGRNIMELESLNDIYSGSWARFLYLHTRLFLLSLLVICFIRIRKLFQKIGTRRPMLLRSGSFPTARTTMAGDEKDFIKFPYISIDGFSHRKTNWTICQNCISWMASLTRMKYVRWLQKYIGVHIYGDCGTHKCGKV